MRKIQIIIWSLLFISCSCLGQVSSLISVGANGKLIYTADAKGNEVPDYSCVGYKNSDTAIPTYAIVKTVYPVAGDNLSNVQNAIDQVALMPVGSDGFRGAILFKAGHYNISDTIKINASGIILIGEGNDSLTGTHFIASVKNHYSLFEFKGAIGIATSSSSRKAITDAFVPIGAKKVTVAAGHNFKAGNSVVIHRIPNQAWIDLLTMAQWGWTYPSYDIYYERKVISVNGNQISLDAPLVDVLDTTYCTAELLKYSTYKIEQCAIENMAISSYYASDTDENHGWEAVMFDNSMNCWARNLNVYYFGYAAVHLKSGASWITVDNCKMIDPKSVITGERRYSFGIDGQHCLVQNCFTRKGRHDFVTGSRTPGPNVFYNNQATLQNSDIGPHHRWATGILFDRIVSNGSQNVQNRESMGSGHGWSGAQVMYWNCKAGKMIIHDPQGDAINWAIGCIAPTITNVGDATTEPLGIVESQNTNITAIPSLFIAQLNDRKGTINKLNQKIIFNSLNIKSLGDTDFLPTCSSSVGLPVTLTSLNTAVATIVNGKIHIVGVGTAVITASQQGNATYLPAANYSHLLQVQNPLAINEVVLYGKDDYNSVELNWDILLNQNEIVNSYEVQKSNNGINFHSIETILNKNTNHYTYNDLLNNTYSTNYYRIKINLSNNKTIYSNTIILGNSKNTISISPNPVIDKLFISGLSGSNVIRIYNNSGQLLLEKKTNNLQSISIDFNSYNKGIYYIKILNTQNELKACFKVIK